jgi:RecJ-like exonuclease
LDREVIKEVAAENPDVVIFTDLGAGQLNEIKEKLDKCFVIVLDHHQPMHVEHETLFHINPHNYGIDGAREISGAGVAYLFSKSLNPDNMDLSALAIIGAVGDIQNSEGYLNGANKAILEEGVKAGVIRVEKDLRLFGRQTRPLYKAIEYTTEPFIPGLSGSESQCLQFLNDLDIPIKKDEKFTMLADLNNEERQRLVTALILKMIEHKVPPKFAESIVGDVYTLLLEEKRTPLRDVKEYATLLNACGKHENYGVGIAVCLGERNELYSTSLTMLKKHKSYLFSCYGWISQNMDRIKDREVLYYFHADGDINENVIGTVASMVLNSRILITIKPILAFTKTNDGFIKVSSRGTKELVEKGLNLGKVMSYASKKIGGEGGGHDIAAGAKIEKGKEEEFLKYAEEEIRRQIAHEGER